MMDMRNNKRRKVKGLTHARISISQSEKSSFQRGGGGG